MAKLEIQQKKELMNTFLDVDLTGINGEVYKYKVSMEMVNILNEFNQKNREKMMKKITKNIKGANIDKFDDINNIISKIGIDKALDLQKEIMDESKIFEKLYDVIPNVPTKEELKEMFEENFGEFHEILYMNFLEAIYVEILGHVEKMGLVKRP